jgi:hypothetical protein
MLGTTRPSNDEITNGQSTRVEWYRCLKCGAVSRFPRYNAASCILQNHRGRCGEYSLLVYRMLRSLGHQVRYVTDLGNYHVWAEVYMKATNATRGDNQEEKLANYSDTATDSQGERWVSIDPCEAALDQNLLYQGWGRHINKVVAFYVPPSARELHHLDNCCESTNDTLEVPLVEDVTASYTTRELKSRKSVQEEIEAMTASLESRLLNISAPTRISSSVSDIANEGASD